MPGHQRILVVSTTAEDAEVARLRDDLGRDPLVLTAPTGEAKRVVSTLAVEPQVEVLLASVASPPADRGHRLDTLVRRHALQDRFRDVVVVTDAATSTLLLRSLAPDQLSGRGAVTLVGLPRGERQVAVRRGVVTGVVLGVASGVVEPIAPFPALSALVAVVGLVLLLGPAVRHVGREVLLAAGISLVVAFAALAGSSRFPGGW